MCVCVCVCVCFSFFKKIGGTRTYPQCVLLAEMVHDRLHALVVCVHFDLSRAVKQQVDILKGIEAERERAREREREKKMELTESVYRAVK